jgi:hypothetical protein
MNDYDDAASQYVFSDVCHRSKDSYCVLLQQFHIDVTLHSCERQHIIRLSEEESSAIRNGMFFLGRRGYTEAEAVTILQQLIFQVIIITRYCIASVY